MQKDYPRGARIYAELIDQIEISNLIHNILFNNDANFHACRKFNGHNFCILRSEKPTEYFRWYNNTPQVNVWLGMIKSKVYLAFFFANPILEELFT